MPDNSAELNDIKAELLVLAGRVGAVADSEVTGPPPAVFVALNF